MSCSSAKAMVFAVYELYPDGSEHSEYKTLSITKKENDDALTARGWAHMIGDGIDDYGIIIVMFNKFYGFTIGPNGFLVRWDNNERLTNGFLNWCGPREPTIRCGGNWWRIKRLV